MPLLSPAPAVRLAAPLLAALLAACTVGPNFVRPAPPTDTAYRPANPAPAAVSPASSNPAARPGEWWSLFGSRELDAVVRQAIAGSPSLAAAEATLAQSQELVAAQAGGRLPQVSLDVGALRQQYGAQFLGSFQLPPFTAFGIGPTVRYVLDYDGGVARSIEQAAALAQYQAGQADAAYLALTGDVVMQSILIAADRARIQELAQLIEEDRDNLHLVQTAFNAGSISRVDVLTAQSQLAADQTLLPPVRQELDAARHQLSVLVGHTPAEWAPPDFELDRLTLPRQLPLSLPSELIHDRPDILSAEAQLHAATAAVGVATANLYPRITLTAGVSLQALRPEKLFDASSSAWSLVSGLSEPLFDGGTLRARRRAALDAMHASAQKYRQVVLQSFAQVADLLDALDHDAELLAAQTNAVATAQDNVQLARESFAAGNSGVLQVLDAQRLHEQAVMGLLQAQTRRYLDTAQLLLAMGGRAPRG
ncbi:MAG TPA: efflux transporter outer membrane subunit [Steroidobacteraceae bacterium]|nr:efflux transporter outer membrane subunit [Steroidobacteraceae bacterium]